MARCLLAGLLDCMYVCINCTNIGAIPIVLCVDEMAIVNFAIFCFTSLILTLVYANSNRVLYVNLYCKQCLSVSTTSLLGDRLATDAKNAVVTS